MSELTDSEELFEAKDADVPLAGSPGREIRLAREHLGLSLEELAAQTRLARSTLSALEIDDFSLLVEPVYVRGYYRKCAKVLQLSEARLIAAYERLVKPKPLAYAPPKLLLSTGEGGKSHWLRWWLMLPAVLVFAVALAWRVFYTPDVESGSTGAPSNSAENPEQSAASDVPSTAPETVTGTEEKPAASGTQGQTHELTHEPSPAAAPHASAPEAVKPPISQPAQNVPPPAAPSNVPMADSSSVPPPPDSLVLSFRQTSWVRVEDKSGSLLLTGLMPAGVRKVVAGHPPYSIFLGNAPGVQAEFNGQPIDIRIYTHENSTARLSVPVPPADAAN